MAPDEVGAHTDPEAGKAGPMRYSAEGVGQ